jgi:hypothetical protein
LFKKKINLLFLSTRPISNLTKHVQDFYRVIHQTFSTLVSAPINCEQWDGSDLTLRSLFRDDYDEYLDYNSHALGCVIIWEVLGQDVKDKEPVKEMVADQVSPAMGQEAQLE